MSRLNLPNITKSFLDVRLISLGSWRLADEITPRDHGGPSMITQAGYASEDMKPSADEFVLGRFGEWLSRSLFFRRPLLEHRAEFIFGTAAGIMEMKANLAAKVITFWPGPKAQSEPNTPEPDEMATAYHAENRKLGDDEPGMTMHSLNQAV